MTPKKRQPFDTDHGDNFVATLSMAASPERIWEVLTIVDAWPEWHPLVGWTSAQIRGERDKFTMLIGDTLLAVSIKVVDYGRSAQLRCFLPSRPQPPAADCCIELVPLENGLTDVIATMTLEPWLLESLEPRLAKRSPSGVLLEALKGVVEKPHSGIVSRPPPRD